MEYFIFRFGFDRFDRFGSGKLCTPLLSVTVLARTALVRSREGECGLVSQRLCVFGRFKREPQPPSSNTLW